MSLHLGRETIPLVMDGQDTVAMVRTGSGKKDSLITSDCHLHDLKKVAENSIKQYVSKLGQSCPEDWSVFHLENCAKKQGKMKGDVNYTLLPITSQSKDSLLARQVVAFSSRQPILALTRKGTKARI